MKVLVISANAFSQTQNNGKTYEAIFSKFKKEEICQLYTRPQDKKLIDYNYACSYYLVSEVNIIKRLLLRQKTCGDEIKSSESFDCPTVYSKRMRLKIHPIFRDLVWSIPLWKDKSLNDWIKKMAPEHIFLVGGGERFIYEICWYISRKYNIPYSLYYTDDYLIYPKIKGMLDYIQKMRMKKFYGRAIREANHAFVIGQKMKKEYENYFNRDFISIMNSIRIYPYKQHVVLNKPYSLSYFGGLHLDRWKMIVRLAAVCKNDFEIFIYSMANPSIEVQTAFDDNNVKFMGGVSPEEVHDKMTESDFLLHVECDNDFKSLTKLSVSTKIPEYLISGVPIIAYGPTDVASIQLLSDNGIGYVLDSKCTDEELSIGINQIAKLEDYYEISQKGYKYARNNCDNDIISTVFYNTICG